MNSSDIKGPVEELAREIDRLERQIANTADPGEKRLLKRRLKKTQHMRLLFLGKLG